MNIKKFLIISSMALQFSTIMYASQANFNAAFLAFGGGTNLITAASQVEANKGQSGTKAVAGIKATLNNTTESTIVAKYLSKQALTSAETTSLTAAFASAKGQSSTSATTTTTTPTTTTSSTTTTPTTTTTTGTTTPTTSTTTGTTTTTPTTTTTTGTTTTTPTTGTTTGTTTTPTTSTTTTDQAAIDLKNQINLSIGVYNTYLTFVGKASVATLA